MTDDPALRTRLGTRFVVSPTEFPFAAGRILSVSDVVMPMGTTTIFVGAKIGPKVRWFRENETYPAPVLDPVAARLRDGITRLRATTPETNRTERTAMTAADRLSELATTIAADRRIDLSAALKEAAMQLPEVAQRWRDEIRDAPAAVLALSAARAAGSGRAFEMLVQHHQTAHAGCTLREAIHHVGRLYPDLATHR